MLFEKFANDLSCSEQKQYMLAEAHILNAVNVGSSITC